MSETGGVLRKPAFLETGRKDAWWLQPVGVGVGLTLFVIYATWAIFQGSHYTHGPYMSPLYGIELYGSSSHALLGGIPTWWPALIPFSPAFLVAWAPAGFRLTCYYYRGAYYKAFWGDPVNCAVGEARSSYRGERWFPLVFQNIHRYFMYLAVAMLFILVWDVYQAVWFEDGFGIGLGTLLLALNTVLLAGYTFGCHSLRHLVGGRFNRAPRNPVTAGCLTCVNACNRNHMKWAWSSLGVVGLVDLYIRLCSMGVITDWRII